MVAAWVGLFGLEGSEVPLAVAAVGSGGVWLLSAGLLYLGRRPPEPPVGVRTLDLGPEPPAVVNFLVNDFTVTDDAVSATLIDLAARRVAEVEQRGPGVFFIRLRPAADESLTAYERRVLEHLRRRASDGVVPGEALTTGPGEESSRWRRAFGAEVVADAQARGLSQDALDGRAFTVLTVAAGAPAVLALALWSFEAAILVMGSAIGILGWIRARHLQRETEQGLAAASRWLGVRAELAENEEFPTHSPLTVALWDRLLAYGAALGVASGASGPLPMGTESDTDAWSAYGGRWRPVRVEYPRLWPPGWGLDPLVALALGLGAVVLGALALYWVGPGLLDAVGGRWSGLVDAAALLVPSAAVVAGIAVAVMAFADLTSAMELTGPILRLRVFGDEDRSRYYIALDDGSSRRVRALRVDPRHYVGLRQGESVTIRLTKNLGCVRWIIREEEPAELVDSAVV